VSSHFKLELGEADVGFLRSAEGGGLKADILTYQQGSVQDHWRQAGRPKFDDITLSVGMNLSKSFYSWISAFFARKGERMHGAIVSANFNYKEVGRRTFTQALISQVDLPALDASKAESAYMTVKITPEMVTFEAKDGPKLEAPQRPESTGKLWQSSNFLLTVDGYDDACKRVTKVDAFSLKQQILEYPSGDKRFPLRIPGKLEYPNITFYVPAVDAGPFVDASKKRLMDFEAPAPTRLNGAIQYLTNDKKLLCTVTLTGVDIISAEAQKLESSAETFLMYKVSIQVEKIDFEYKTDAVG
jgi:phage tail-like protein